MGQKAQGVIYHVLTVGRKYIGTMERWVRFTFLQSAWRSEHDDRKGHHYYTRWPCRPTHACIVVMTLAVIMGWGAVIMGWGAVIMEWRGAGAFAFSNLDIYTTRHGTTIIVSYSV